MSDRQKQRKSAEPARITRAKRGKIDRGECNDGLSCSSCGNDIHVNADHVVLSPCNCILCTRCLLNSHALRGSFAMYCPTCDGNDTKVTSHRYFSARTPDEEDTNYKTCLCDGEETDDYIKNNFPKKHLAQKEGAGVGRLEEGESIAVLYAFRLKKGKNNNVERYTYTETISDHIKTEDDMEDYSTKCGKFMAFLHELIVRPSKIERDDVPNLMPAEVVDYYADRYSQSPLLSSLYGLATGRGKADIDKITLDKGDYADYQSQFLAVAVAEGMLLRSIFKYPGVIQKMLFEQLTNENISQPRLNLLSAMRILPSRSYCTNAQCKEVQKLVEDMDKKLHPLDLFMVNQDNISFQEVSKQARHVQYTAIQDIVVRKEKLYELGIYGDNPLSRLGKSWSDICSQDASTKTLAKRIIGVTEEAKEYFSEIVMEDILLSILLCIGGDIPGTVGAHIPHLGRTISPDMNTSLTTGTSADTTDTPISSEGAIRTLPNHSIDDCKIGSGSMYQNKDTTITLNMIQENLSSESTIIMTADYVCNVCNKQCQRHDYENEVEHPIAEDLRVIMADGAPATQYFALLKDDQNQEMEDRKYPGLMAFFGGFHTLLKLANCNGELFSNILDTFVGSWRETGNKIAWFGIPSDPKQREAETPQHTAAHYAAAARSLFDMNGSWPSAAEVNTHMIERAEKYPICALILLFLRGEAILKMLRVSEKIGRRGSVELFFHCLKLAVPIFAVTHKIDYMRLVSDLLQWYECASPALQVIYQELIYTQVTSFGKSRWADLSMETTIGHFRKLCGRKHTRGTGIKLEHACHTIPKMRNHGDVMDGLRTGVTGGAVKKQSKSKQTMKLFDDSPILRVLPVIEEMRLWHNSDNPCFKEKGVEGIIELEPGDLRLPGGDSVNPEVLDCFGTGSERATNYFQHYNINNPTQNHRSEKEVSLQRILPSKKERQAALDREIMAATSTDKKALDDLSVKELLVHIEETRKMLNSKGVQPQIRPEKKSGNKPEKIGRLIELRGILFAMDKRAKSNEVIAIRKQFEAKKADFKKNMNSILNDPLGLYAISHTVLDKERYKKSPESLQDDDKYVML